MTWWRSARTKIGVSVVSMLVTFGAAEAAVRLATGRLSQTRNFLRDHMRITQGHLPTIPDPAVGWTLQSNFRDDDDPWHARVSTDEFGLRRNSFDGGAASTSSFEVLAIGDSYTFGEEVSDEDSWPARLARHIQVPVLNGGVSGYGCDQVFLRAQRLVPQFSPRLVIFSIYPDDIARTQMSMRFGAFKPFYTLDGDGLRLNNSPVPVQTATARELGLAQNVLGYSLALHQVFITYRREWWLAGTFGQRQEHSDGVEVTKRLVLALKEYCDRSGVALVLAAQYDRAMRPAADELIRPVMEYARHIGIPVFDPGGELRALRSDDASAFDLLFTRHMTPEGNEWFASRLAEFLRDAGKLEHSDSATHVTHSK